MEKIIVFEGKRYKLDGAALYVERKVKPFGMRREPWVRVAHTAKRVRDAVRELAKGK